MASADHAETVNSGHEEQVPAASRIAFGFSHRVQHSTLHITLLYTFSFMASNYQTKLWRGARGGIEQCGCVGAWVGLTRLSRSEDGSSARAPLCMSI